MEVGSKIIYIGTHDEDVFEIYETDIIDTRIVPWNINFVHLTYNNTYEVTEPYYNVESNEICVKNDKGEDIVIDKKYFKTLVQLRKDKLNEINKK